uniref:Hcy-binding domain-containing protein n=1 Tax=Steinernema glaseri TaxID=37863 RepID=A0A1I7Z500_9BILA
MSHTGTFPDNVGFFSFSICSVQQQAMNVGVSQCGPSIMIETEGTGSVVHNLKSTMDLNQLERPCVLDGGHGTALEQMGIDVNANALWSFDTAIDNPAACFTVHKGFIDAGARFIMSNTYHGSIEVMMKSRGMSEEAAIKAIAQAVDMAKKAAEEASHKVHVAGSIGPYAIVLRDGSEYSGTYMDTVPRKAVEQYYKAQMKAMLSTGLDWYALETIPRLDEAMVALEVWNSLDGTNEKKLWVSFSCKDHETTNGNDPFHKVVEHISAHSAVSAIGINCTSPQYIAPLIQAAAPVARGKPFVVYPNHGEPYDALKHQFNYSQDDTFPQYLKDIPFLWKHNVRLFGGCCRVKNEHIERITSIVNALEI